MNPQKQAAWDAVHAAYSHNGTPIVSGVPKRKKIIKLAKEVQERKAPPVAPVAEKKEEAPKEMKVKKKPSPTKPVSVFAIEQWLESLVKIDAIEEGDTTDDKVDNWLQEKQDEGEYAEYLEQALEGRGHYKVADMIYKHFLKNGNSPAKIKASMREMKEDGYSMFDEILEKKEEPVAEKKEETIKEITKAAAAKGGSAISESTAKQASVAISKIDEKFAQLDKALEANKKYGRQMNGPQIAHNAEEYKQILSEMVERGQIDQRFADSAISRIRDMNFVFYDYDVRKTAKSIILTKKEKAHV